MACYREALKKAAMTVFGEEITGWDSQPESFACGID
jgi:hypothetical protein